MLCTFTDHATARGVWALATGAARLVSMWPLTPHSRWGAMRCRHRIRRATRRMRQKRNAAALVLVRGRSALIRRREHGPAHAPCDITRKHRRTHKQSTETPTFSLASSGMGHAWAPKSEAGRHPLASSGMGHAWAPKSEAGRHPFAHGRVLWPALSAAAAGLVTATAAAAEGGLPLLIEHILGILLVEAIHHGAREQVEGIPHVRAQHRRGLEINPAVLVSQRLRLRLLLMYRCTSASHRHPARGSRGGLE